VDISSRIFRTHPRHGWRSIHFLLTGRHAR
jgi:hypothetical protein